MRECALCQVTPPRFFRDDGGARQKESHGGTTRGGREDSSWQRTGCPGYAKAKESGRATQKVAKHKKDFPGKCSVCSKVCHKQAESKSGGGGQTASHGPTTITSVQVSTLSCQGMGSQKSTGTAIDKGTTTS